MLEPPLSPDEPFRLAALRDMNVLDTPLEERFERITRLTKRALDVPIVAISLVDGGRQWFKSIQGLAVSETCRSVSFCGHAILENDVLVVPDASEDDRFADNPLVTGDPRIRFYAGCPLRAIDGSAVGTLCIIDREPRELDEDDERALRDFAALVESELRSNAMSCLQNELVSQIETERRQAMVDPLTRLWNRAGILAALESAVMRSDGVALLIGDLDHFKSVNDTMGHPAGDDVLRHVARRMLGVLRATDAIGRFGGEEFLVVVPGCGSVADVHRVAERIRTAVNESPVPTTAGEIEVTISLGVAGPAVRGNSDPSELIRIADEALYRAKAAGRDCVTIDWATAA